MSNITGKLYVYQEGERHHLLNVDLSAYDEGNLPTVIVLNDTCFVYGWTSSGGTVAEYNAVKSVHISVAQNFD